MYITVFCIPSNVKSYVPINNVKNYQTYWFGRNVFEPMTATRSGLFSFLTYLMLPHLYRLYV